VATTVEVWVGREQRFDFLGY